MRPTRYEIVVLGELSDRFRLAFQDMEVQTDTDRTTISGWVVDQAHLHGLINRVGELSLELLDVRVVEAPGEATPVPGATQRSATDGSSGALP